MDSRGGISNSLLFAYPSYQYLIKNFIHLPYFTLGEFSLKRFPNDELYITVQAKPEGRACTVLGSLAPPDTNTLSFLLLCHTLKKEKAANITAVIPYLAYSRHDKNEPQKSYATEFIGELLNAVGVSALLTFDIHSERAKKLLPLSVTNISTTELFTKEIVAQSMQKMTLVAPDEGAIERCKAVAAKAGMSSDIPYLVKKRTESGITHSELQGVVGEHAIIIDDILDTGGTLVSCCKKLSRAGVKQIYIMVTHGQFTGDKWQELWELGVKRIYCTDTIPSQQQMLSPKITVLSIIPQLRDILCHS